MPLVTVVIPTYNTARYLREAIDSVLAQTYSPVELVVVDDGSTDETPALVRAYANRLRYHRQENRGFANALNTGIRLAHGEWIAWLSADDAFLPPKLERQVHHLSHHPEIAVSYTAYYEINESGRRLREVRVRPPYDNHVTPRHLLDCCYVNGSTCLFRRHVFETSGFFDERLGPSADWEMWMRIAHGFRFGYWPEPLVCYRVHPHMTSRRADLMERSSSKALITVFENIPLHDLLAPTVPSPPCSAWQEARLLRETSQRFKHLPTVRRYLLKRSLQKRPTPRAILELAGATFREGLRALARLTGTHHRLRNLRRRLAAFGVHRLLESDKILEFVAISDS